MAPVTDAEVGVLLIGHGSSTQPGAAEDLARHAAALERDCGYSATGYATLVGGPDPTQALAAMEDCPSVYVVPMFMSDGYLARRAVPESLGTVGDRRVRLCPPMGTAPGLARLARLIAEERRQAAGWPAGQAALVVAGHGSTKDGASRAAIEGLADGLREASTFQAVVTGFLEEPPHLTDVAKGLSTPAVVLGAFAHAGNHALADVPEALAASAHPTAYTGAIGSDPRVPSLLRDLVERQRRREGAQTARDKQEADPASVGVAEFSE